MCQLILDDLNVRNSSVTVWFCIDYPEHEVGLTFSVGLLHANMYFLSKIRLEMKNPEGRILDKDSLSVERNQIAKLSL